MRRLTIVITLIIVVVLLIALNAASYVEIEQVVDSESSPDRSTYNAGATGTRAFYDFLYESGYQVAHWRESTSGLLTSSGQRPATLVVIGRTRIPFNKTETEELLSWVDAGGRLVLIDRTPDQDLMPPSTDWGFSTRTFAATNFEVDPADFNQMTAGVKSLHPSQPTGFTRNVETVVPSRFASTITIAHRETPGDIPGEEATDPELVPEDFSPAPSPTPVPTDGKAGSPAPIVHIEQERGALLIDYPHGQGRIIVLSDPFIVANNGINRADNLALAVNIVVGPGGLIAFDEFHQGRASSHNALIQYFSGTPVLAFFGQFVLIGVAIVWSRGRRFARPLPLPHVDRRSSLEFVASMAELQQRARAHDLALENIYGRIRRLLVRHAGLSNASPRSEIAARVATRSGMSRQLLETVMRNCEDTINGAPTSGKQTLLLARHLRDIESRLGLGARSRDVKQNKTDL